ncbi:hypothetical protein F7U73_22580, partial [Vibrio vulnificus]|nr:hypothetical protein [Vibrio vulnificus]
MKKKNDSFKIIHNNLSKIQQSIVTAIDESNYAEVEDQFDKFLVEFVKIGSYNKVSWPVAQSRKWWEFFEVLGRYELASMLLPKIKEKMAENIVSDIEPLEFAYIELSWSISKRPSLHKEKVLKLISDFPHNIEFAHTAAHILSEDKTTTFESIKLYRRCIEEWGGQHNTLISHLYNVEIKIFKATLENGDYLHAEKQLDLIINFEPYSKNALSNNTSLMYKERLRDRKFTEASIKKLKRELTDDIKGELESQSKKNIEQLGVFSAIITFIITAAASAFNSEHSMTPVILISIGLILILFVASMSLLNFKPKKLYLDFRFYVLIIFCLLTYFTVNKVASETRPVQT